MLQARRTDAGPDDLPAEDVNSRFRIIRDHRDGGLGAVRVAEDRQLHREVALKQIKPAYADDAGSR